MSADVDWTVAVSRRWEPSQRVARLVTAGLVAALMAAAAWGVILVTHVDEAPNPATAADSSSVQAQARRDVQLVVSSFAANFNNYSVEDIGAYKQRMLPLMTEDFATSFKYAVDGIVTEVKATEMSSTGEVAQTAVSSIDETRAIVLVVADVDISSALGERQRHFRWKVSVIRDGADWLVDDFEPVA